VLWSDGTISDSADVAKLDEMLTSSPLNYTKHIDPSSGVVFYIHKK
jgi:hypothetical protein